MTWYIYMLHFDNGKRYVGVTRHFPEDRLQQHLLASTRKSQLTLHCAIRKHGTPLIRVLAVCDREDEAKEREVHYIRELGTLRPGGYNSTVGGNGVIDPSGLSEGRRVRKMKRTMATDSYKAKQRAIQEEVWSTSRRSERAESIKKLWQDPEYRARQTEAHTDPDAKCHHKVLLTHEERSARAKAIWDRPGHRERMSQKQKSIQTPARRRVTSKQMKELMADPEYRKNHAERMKLVMNEPEVRKRCSEAHRKAV